jgi:hypothetical protein
VVDYRPINNNANVIHRMPGAELSSKAVPKQLVNKQKRIE